MCYSRSVKRRIGSVDLVFQGDFEISCVKTIDVQVPGQSVALMEGILGAQVAEGRTSYPPLLKR